MTIHDKQQAEALQEQNKMKTTVIHHSADYDGIFCREIAHKFIPDAELIGWDFADSPLQVPEHGTIYVLDLPLDATFGGKSGEFNLGVITAIQNNRLFWIDHHASAIKSHPTETGGYRIDGVAACRLAWQFFNRIPTATLPPKEQFVNRVVPEPLAVRLAGEYDIWDKRDPRADIFQYGLRSRELSESDWVQILRTDKPSIEELERLISVGHDKNLLNPDGTFTPPIVYQLLDTGEILQRYSQKLDSDLVTYKSFRLKWEGLDFLCLNTGRFNSLTFAALDNPETGHDALLGFMWNGKLWTVSLYHATHRKDLDLSVIAVKYGGGGHKGACGFTAKTLPFSL